MLTIGSRAWRMSSRIATTDHNRNNRELSMPLKPASSARVKHKSTLTLDSLPPPKKKLKGEKGVSILSVRYHTHQLKRHLTLT